MKKLMSTADINRTIKNYAVLDTLINDKVEEKNALGNLLKADTIERIKQTFDSYVKKEGLKTGTTKIVLVNGAMLECGLSELRYSYGSFSYYKRCGEGPNEVLRGSIASVEEGAAIVIEWTPRTKSGMPRPNLAQTEYIKYQDIVKEKEAE